MTLRDKNVRQSGSTVPQRLSCDFRDCWKRVSASCCLFERREMWVNRPRKRDADSSPKRTPVTLCATEHWHV